MILRRKRSAQRVPVVHEPETHERFSINARSKTEDGTLTVSGGTMGYNEWHLDLPWDEDIARANYVWLEVHWKPPDEPGFSKGEVTAVSWSGVRWRPDEDLEGCTPTLRADTLKIGDPVWYSVRFEDR